MYILSMRMTKQTLAETESWPEYKIEYDSKLTFESVKLWVNLRLAVTKFGTHHPIDHYILTFFPVQFLNQADQYNSSQGNSNL